jgi:outer membrane protein assembly factor BamE (lipoprotein component of BamABCDE complex)
MFRKSAIAVAVVGLLAAGACAPISSHSGFQAIEASPKDVVVGSDTKSTVQAKLGSPSTQSTFDPNVWYYIAQVKEKTAFFKPKVTSREITAMTFNKDSEVLETVDNITLADGKVIAFNGRETPTRGRELTILEQLLGNVGRGSMLPRDDEGVPGTRPGD